MKKITKEYTVYDYAELSNDAKDKVKEWYLEGIEPDIFTENCLMRLEELFPNSNLKVQYSIAYCQGDGFNIYGEISLDEVLDHIRNNFTEKEHRFLRLAFDNYGSSYTMPVNGWYAYCICSRNNFTENFIDDMESDSIRDIPYETMEKFNNLAGEYLDNLCGEFEKRGYSYFYEASDEDVEEACEANEWTFTADGKLFTA